MPDAAPSPERMLAAFARAPVQDDDARAVMRLSLLDWAACGIAGRHEPVARLLRGHVGQGPCTVIGGTGAAPAQAALVNGATSHALDYDDTHFAHIGHPSVAVIPAALAVAEGTGADMATFLDACLVGAEASVRVGVWLGRGHYQDGFHQTATAGAFGAVLAAARLLALDDDRTVAALGLCATRASGLKSQFGTMGKPYNAGLAAETGVEAALLARAGMTSATAGLSGPQGFGPAHRGAAEASAFDGLGRVWLFTDVSHKVHACCHGLHAMLEAVGGADVAATYISAVEVATHPRWLSVCDIAAPRTGLEAKFSYRLTAAMRLSGRDTGAIGTFSDAAAMDPDLCALRDRVRVTGDDGLTEMQAHVTLHLTDGTARHLAHDLNAPQPLKKRAARIRVKAQSLIGNSASQLQTVIDANDLAGLAAVLRA